MRLFPDMCLCKAALAFAHVGLAALEGAQTVAVDGGFTEPDTD